MSDEGREGVRVQCNQAPNPRTICSAHVLAVVNAVYLLSDARASATETTAMYRVLP